MVDLSAFYFDVLKDRLYTFAPRKSARRSAQTAVYRIASALLRSADADHGVHGRGNLEVFSARRGRSGERAHGAVSEAGANAVASPTRRSTRAGANCVKVRTEVLARWSRRATPRQSPARSKRESNWPPKARWPNCCENTQHGSRAVHRFAGGTCRSACRRRGSLRSAAGLGRRVHRADGAKCERCWNYSTHVGESADYPTVCERCVTALNEIERGGSQSGAAGS